MDKREKRAKLYAEMQEIDAICKKEGRSMTDDEKKAFSDKENEIRSLDKEIEADERAAALAGFSSELPSNPTMETGNEEEARAMAFAQSGTMEIRTVLATGNIAKPAKASNDVNGLGEVGDSIVDDVNAIPLSGTGSWVAAYKVSEAEAAAVTDGSDVAGTASVYNYVTITPAEVGVLDMVSKQVKKMTPTAYETAVKNSALIALRSAMAAKIIAGVTGSTIKGQKFSATLDATYLRSLVLGFDSIEGKGEVMLYINKADLITLGSVRGTNEKKPVYEIIFDAGTTKSGIIKDGATAVKFRVLNGLSTGTQLFGQPGTIDMPMWDNYSIETDEGGDFFKKNQIGIRGIQTANAALVAKYGMYEVKQAAAPAT